jgi:arsenate reductase
MAEGLVNAHLPGQWQAFSAGTRPAGQVHELATRVMAELGVDIGPQIPKSLDALRGVDLDLVITLCDSAAQECPLWPGGGQRVHMAFPDPAEATGSEEQRIAKFRSVRDAIHLQVLELLGQYVAHPPGPGTDGNDRRTGAFVRRA